VLLNIIDVQNAVRRAMPKGNIKMIPKLTPEQFELVRTALYEMFDQAVLNNKCTEDVYWDILAPIMPGEEDEGQEEWDEDDVNSLNLRIDALCESIEQMEKNT